MTITIRLANIEDIPALHELIEASVRGLSERYYSRAQIESALEHVFGVDTQLIIDGTCFVAESDDVKDSHPATISTGGTPVSLSGDFSGRKIIGSGGWSKRKTLFGGDQSKSEIDPLLDPADDPARVRAFYIDPAWSRRGIATMILEACENAARQSGFKRVELAATLPGVPFYLARGYVKGEEIAIRMEGGEVLITFRMTKAL